MNLCYLEECSAFAKFSLKLSLFLKMAEILFFQNSNERTEKQAYCLVNPAQLESFQDQPIFYLAGSHQNCSK